MSRPAPPLPPPLTADEAHADALSALRVPGEYLHESLAFGDLLDRIATYATAADGHLADGRLDQAILAVAAARSAAVFLRRRAISHASGFAALNRRAEALVATLTAAEAETLRADHLAGVYTLARLR